VSQMQPRVPPLTDLDALSPQQNKLRQRLGRRGEDPKNIFRTLLRFPDFMAAMMPLAAHCADAGGLTPRLRELVILRSAWRCDCEYEWAQHAETALAAGLSAAQIEAVAAGAFAAEWLPQERLVLRAVDELHEADCICDATWAALDAFYGEATIVDLIATCGFYHMLAWQLRSLGVPIEPGRPGFSPTLRRLREDLGRA